MHANRIMQKLRPVWTKSDDHAIEYLVAAFRSSDTFCDIDTVLMSV